MRKGTADRYLLLVILLAAGFLLFYQSLCLNSPFRTVVDQVGSDAQAVMKQVETTDNSINLRLMNFSTLPKAKVLLNGKVITDFTHPYVTIPVSAGDNLEIDTSYYDYPIKIMVLDTTKNVLEPKTGIEFTGQKTVLSLGKVKLAEK